MIYGLFFETVIVILCKKAMLVIVCLVFTLFNSGIGELCASVYSLSSLGR